MKRAVVTGASGNLGKSVVEQLLLNGYTVSGTGQLPESVTGYTGVTIDLTDEQATAEWVRSLLKEGDLHTAVLTVGGFAMGDLSATGTTAIHEQLRLNFDTAYHVARPVFLHMKEKGSGTIFLIGSQAGMDAAGNAGVIAYGLSKSLLFRLADLMNLEARGTSVKVFVVVPFIIDTPQNRTAMPGSDFTKWQTPEQIALRIIFYAEDPAARDTCMIF